MLPLLDPSDIGPSEPNEVSISPTSGPPGTTVSIVSLTGSAFTEQSTVDLQYSGFTNYLWRVRVPSVDFDDTATDHLVHRLDLDVHEPGDWPRIVHDWASAIRE